MLGEDVEVDRGDQRVAERILLAQEARVRARILGIPGAPFVDRQEDALLRIIFVHDRAVLGDQFVHAPGAGKRIGPAVLVEVDRRRTRRPAAGGVDVVMERHAVELRRGHAHHRLGPVIVLDVRAGGDLHDLGAGRRLDEGRVAAGLVGRELRPHVAAAAPQLVADAEERHRPGRLVAVPGALVGEAAGGRGHVFDPLGHLARGAVADVARDIGFGTDLAQQLEELVRADRVRLGHAAPMGVDLDRTLVLRADTLAPIIFVGEAPARPADHRHLQVAERRDHVVAEAVGVRDLGVLADPQPLVDAVAQMLGELGEDAAIIDRAGLVALDRDGGGGGAGGGRLAGRTLTRSGLGACGERGRRKHQRERCATEGPDHGSSLPLLPQPELQPGSHPLMGCTTAGETRVRITRTYCNDRFYAIAEGQQQWNVKRAGCRHPAR